MKYLIALIALTFISACASKKTSTEPATKPAETTPAAKTDEKTNIEKSNTKKESKKSKKSVAAPSTESKTGTAEVNCKAGTDERKLTIAVKDGGCELQYVKAGETKVIATQIKGSEKCEEVMTSVKEKLVAADFTCQ